MLFLAALGLATLLFFLVVWLLVAVLVARLPLFFVFAATPPSFLGVVDLGL